MNSGRGTPLHLLIVLQIRYQYRCIEGSYGEIFLLSVTGPLCWPLLSSTVINSTPEFGELSWKNR